MKPTMIAEAKTPSEVLNHFRGKALLVLGSTAIGAMLVVVLLAFTPGTSRDEATLLAAAMGGGITLAYLILMTLFWFLGRLK